MKFARFVVLLGGGFFVLYGFVFAIVPAEFFRLVSGSDLTGVSGLVDFRATYGGMTFAVGVTIFYLARKGRVPEALTVTAIVLFSMAATRFVGFLIEGTTNWLMYVYFVLELGGGELAWYANKRLRENPQAFMRRPTGSHILPKE